MNIKNNIIIKLLLLNYDYSCNFKYDCHEIQNYNNFGISQ